MRLLKIELAKLIPYRTFKILFFVYLLLMVLALLSGNKLAGPETEGLTSDKVLGFPNVWNYYTFYASLFNIILAILVVFVVCNEYSYRTLRQNVIDGLRRDESVTAKIMLIILLAVISTVILIISGSIAGYIYSTDATKNDFTGHTGFILAYFVQTLGLLSMGYLFGTIFKRTGLAVIIFLIFLFPVDAILREAIFPDGFGDYMPVATYFLKLIPSPLIHAISGGMEPLPAGPTALALTVGMAYAILFCLIALVITKKRDL